MSPETGNRLWREFHALTDSLPQGPLSAEQRERVRIWLEEFAGRVATASAEGNGCPCNLEWQLIMLTHPPDLRTSETLRIWGYQQHDRVNYRLGKPLWMPVHHPDYAVTFQGRSDIITTPPA